jgi:hypothetical protein
MLKRMDTTLEEELLASGKLKERCSEAIAYACNTCGESFPSELWISEDNSCPACAEGHPIPKASCDLCGRTVAEAASGWQGGSHRCHSIAIFHETGRLVFAPELSEVSQEDASVQAPQLPPSVDAVDSEAHSPELPEDASDDSEVLAGRPEEDSWSVQKEEFSRQWSFLKDNWARQWPGMKEQWFRSMGTPASAAPPETPTEDSETAMAEVNTATRTNAPTPASSPVRVDVDASDKLRVIALLLLIFLSFTSAHRFYIGRWRIALLQIAMWFGTALLSFALYLTMTFQEVAMDDSRMLLLMGLPMIPHGGVMLWYLIDFILIITGSMKDANGKTVSRWI